MDVFVTAPQDAGTSVAPIYQFFNAGVYVDYSFFFFTPTAGQTQEDLRVATASHIATYASAHSYTVSSTSGWYPDTATVSKDGVFSSYDKTKLDALSAGSFKSYQALISQSGTSAPSATQMVTDFGATTFTWARSSAGVYTCTANAAVFTSGKTGILITDPSNALWAFRPVITSTTVITLTTSVLAILAVVLGATATDNLLSSNLFEVRVYP